MQTEGFISKASWLTDRDSCYLLSDFATCFGVCLFPFPARVCVQVICVYICAQSTHKHLRDRREILNAKLSHLKRTFASAAAASCTEEEMNT